MTTGTVREVYEGCFQPGAEVSYRGLRLEKLEWSAEPQPWRLFRDGEWVASIRPDKYPSTVALQRDLDRVVDGGEPTPQFRCSDCPLASAPSD
ncbi:hypothetical protein [Natrinema versiforme]|uniref:hypothetical protein n=1 Tax=Natrinema versiforme TaxID=88724 RepID=UPI000AAE1B22|nr:hypothetical protein [Natrinema versiforme]